jgi:Flp pilus assembly protein TadG
LRTLERAFGRVEEGGQVLVMTALLMTTLIFAVGIAFDLGTLFVAKRALQEAVDAAAFGGAVVLYNNGTGGAAVAAAQKDFDLQGYDWAGDTSFTTKQFLSPPPTGHPLAGQAAYIDIVITQNVRVPLLPLQGGTMPVTVRSTGGGVRQPSNYALMALNATGIDSLVITSGGTVSVTGNVQVNSSHATQGARGGTGAFTVVASTPPYSARAVGGVVGLSAITPNTPPARADPFAGYLRPTTPSGSPKPALSISTTTTVSPDIYAGITLTGAPGGGATVTFNNGVYILAGGGFSATGNFTINSLTPVASNGVMFFNTHSNYPNTPVGTCSPISLQVDSGITLSGPPNGYYQGMLFFQDPVCTNDLQLKANSGVQTGNGSIYAPKAKVLVSGGGNMTVNGQIIADTISIDELNVTIVYSTATSASPSMPALVQ